MAAVKPIMVYNNPLTYGGDVTPKMFAELAEDTKFAAIKESSGDVRRIGRSHQRSRQPLRAVLRRRQFRHGSHTDGRTAGLQASCVRFRARRLPFTS